MGRDRRGVSAVAFAISFAVLTPMALGVFDVYQSSQQQGKLQDALDAATLYAARSTATDTPGVAAVGSKALGANMQLIPGAKLTSSSFALVSSQGDTKVVAQATVTLAAYAPMEFTHNPVTVSSEVTRPGNNLEVALVLDNSNSMAGASLTALKSAANQLVDLVVSDAQTPYYSKVSIVPYANAVNAGTYAAAARGIVQSGTNGTTGINGTPPNASFKFRSQTGLTKTLTISNCVSERIGAQAYTDASPAGAAVGLDYAQPSNNGCIVAPMAALSSDKTAIKASIASLQACCSTGGQIGIAWGWYTLSPNWSSLFTGNAAPAAYGAAHTIKALVLMTDGEYNSIYCNGVIAQNSTSGSGDTNYHINCNGQNGKDPYAQAQALCQSMKNLPNPIIIYTVGLNVLGTPAAADLVNKCATDAAHVYLPADGASMQVAFQSIASDLNKLRISH